MNESGRLLDDAASFNSTPHSNDEVFRNERNQRKDLKKTQLVGYGFYNLGFFATVIPLMIVILPTLTKKFVSDVHKVSSIQIQSFCARLYVLTSPRNTPN